MKAKNLKVLLVGNIAGELLRSPFAFLNRVLLPLMETGGVHNLSGNCSLKV